MPHKRSIPRVCQQCGGSFLAEASEVRLGKARYCSRSCAAAQQPPRKNPVGKIPCVCQHCGTTVYRYPSQAQKYCSMSCRGRAKTGPQSPRWGKPASRALSRAVARTCLVCRKSFTCKPSRVAHGFGLYCSWACRNAAQRAVDGEQRSGERLHRCDYRHWRKAVFERDRYTCQQCGAIGGTLNAHHIRSWRDYPALRFEVSNGVTLCVVCHANQHAPHAAP